MIDGPLSRPRTRAGWLGATALAGVVAVAAACSAAGASPAAPTAASASIPPVVRAILAAGDPANADGQKLELARYTIQPGTKLAAQHHPGMQLAFIESGTLTYTVIEGTVTITAADGTTRTVGPGETATIAPGEWLVESEDIVHFGENGGNVPVVILAASLFEAGEPPAIPVDPSPSGGATPALKPSPVEPGFGTPPPGS